MSEQPTGTIHDLRYQRYAGERRAANTRWRVIMRNQIATAWKTWWRYKAALSIAVLTTCIAGGMMILFKDKLVGGMFKNFTATLADAALPRTIAFYSRAAFLLSLTIGSRVIASDAQTGAFVFYFARSTRPRDYVLGKLAGMAVLTAALSLAGPLVLAITRLALAQTSEEALALLPLVPKALVIGLVGTMVFATVPVMFSAIVKSSRAATALWVAYYLVFGGMVSLIGSMTHSWIGVLDLATAIDAVAFKLCNVSMFSGRAANIAIGPALLSLSAHVVVAVTVIAVHVRREHGAGVGGAT